MVLWRAHCEAGFGVTTPIPYYQNLLFCCGTWTGRALTVHWRLTAARACARPRVATRAPDRARRARRPSGIDAATYVTNPNDRPVVRRTSRISPNLQTSASGGRTGGRACHATADATADVPQKQQILPIGNRRIHAADSSLTV